MITVSLLSAICTSILWLIIWLCRKRRWLRVIERLRYEKSQTVIGLVRQHERASLAEDRLIQREDECRRLRGKVNELRRNKRFIES